MSKEMNKAYHDLTQSSAWVYLKQHLENMMRRDVRYAMTQEDVMANNKQIAQAETAKSLLTLVTSKAAEHLRVQKPLVTLPPTNIITE